MSIAFVHHMTKTTLVLLLCRILQSIAQEDACSSCVPPTVFNPDRHQQTYTVGVLANRGPAIGYAQYNSTFATYLTLTAGRKFDPPIAFEMLPVDFQEMFDFTADKTIDFTFVNPSASTCIGAQYGTQSLLSLSKKIVVDGEAHEVSEFAGIMLARADNDQVNQVVDLQDKVVGAVSIASFGGALLQFHEMIKAGMSYINDPKGIVYTENQFAVIRGVLDGVFDAGFVRTGMIQIMKDSDGNPIDASLLKILQPRQGRTSEGGVFPHEHSTPLYPEWHMAALGHVASEVSAAVQDSLYSLSQHAAIGELMVECEANQGDICQNISALHPNARCDTTVDVAMAAYTARDDGSYAAFRPTLSYSNVRGLLQDTRSITKDEELNVWRCRPPAEVYDSITCPEGYFLRSRADFDESCGNLGIECPDGYHCACKPCFEATDIEVAPTEAYSPGEGCGKMSVCGTVEKSTPGKYVIVDNKDREGLEFRIIQHEGDSQLSVAVIAGESPNVYEFEVVADQIGNVILEIFLGDEQIPASPLRVKVVPHDCGTDSRIADDLGNCVCPDYYIEIGGRCVDKGNFFMSLFLPLGIIALMGILLYSRMKHREADTLWVIDEDELRFSKPTQVIGDGSFGIVVLAEYRGAKVAVKKAFVVKESPSESRSPTGFVRRRLSSQSGEDKTLQRKKSSDIESQDDDFVDGNGPRSRTSSISLFSGERSGRLTRRLRKGSPLKRDFEAEIRVLTKLRHPNITTLMGAVLSKKGPPLTVLEYMEHGSLYEVLHNPTFELEAVTILQVMRDIAKALRFLHSWKPQIVHGDMKSANVLIDSTFRAKLADIVFTKSDGHTGATGTTVWMAPELLNGESNNTPQSDMYSVGVIYCEIYSRQDPYEEAIVAEKELLNDICDPMITRRPQIPSCCPENAKTLIEGLWHHDPTLRPTAEALDGTLHKLDAVNMCPKSTGMNGSTTKGRTQLDDFIYQAFPRHVADVLKAGGKVEPESHPLVTIVFSDIVGFTTIASRYSPIKISDLLDRLYLKLDELARKYCLFKIETIGDGYMAASNLVEDQDTDHVKRAAMFSMDAMQAARETLVDEDDPDAGSVSIRVGFHSGPVVSNVVGSLNPRYGLFGDAVNIASRMESTSEVGRVHCSRESAKLLVVQAPDMSVCERGSIKVKGRGMMTTYWVN